MSLQKTTSFSVSDLTGRNSLSGSTSNTSVCRPLVSSGETMKKRASEALMDAVRMVPNTNTENPDLQLNGRHLPTAGRGRKGRTAESDLVSSKDKPLAHTQLPKSGNFDWTSYLKDADASAVGVGHFFHVPLDIQNECIASLESTHICPPLSSFKPGQCMEGIDPHNESLFCTLKITEVVGRRLRLRFIGYPEKYDFWTTVDSPFLFPVGWCEHNQRMLQPPKGYSEHNPTMQNFEWNSFLLKENLTAVPRHLFRVHWDSPLNPTPPHLFRVGHKLEAVDKRNPDIACVATIKDCIGDYILIHFDGWNKSFDQWAHITSQLIHPVGYCEDQEFVLSIPNDWNNRPTGFTWKQYLKETNSKPVPKEAFDKCKVQTPVEKPQVGQRLEAVDKRCPQLIRVAHVVSNQPIGFLTIGFDGWSDKLNRCVESTSTDLFPVGYCHATGHPLQPPPGHESDIELNGASGDAHSNSSTSSLSTVQPIGCPTTGCKGYGHIKGPRHSTHQRISGCPYADMNLKKDLIRPHDRLAAYNLSSPIPDSTSLTLVPNMDQQTGAGGGNPFQMRPNGHTGGGSLCLSPDSSMKTEAVNYHNSDSPLSTDPVESKQHNVDTSSTIDGGASADSSRSEQPAKQTAASISPFTTTTTSVSGITSIPSGESNNNSNTIPILPLDLSVERDKKIDCHHPPSDPINTTTKVTKIKRAADGVDEEPNTANQKIPFGTLIGSSKPPSRKPLIGSKRPISSNTDVKSRPSQIAQAANEYARQQQLFGLSGLPVKRKRGRPRKCTTFSVFNPPSDNSTAAALQSPLSPSSRNTLQPIPHSYAPPSANIQSLNFPATATAPLIPDPSIYGPLTLGAPLSGLHSNCMSLIGNGEEQQPPTNRSISPLGWTYEPTPNSGCPLVIQSVSSQHSSSTEPATTRSPNAFDALIMSSAPDFIQSTSTTVSSAHNNNSCSTYDFCIMNSTPALLPTAANVNNHCIDSLSSSLSALSAVCSLSKTQPYLPPITLTTSFSQVPMYSDPPIVSLAPTSRRSALNSMFINPSSMISNDHHPAIPSASCSPTSANNRAEFDLMRRLLPQASAALHASKVAGLAGPHTWNVEMVGNFVSTLPGCRQFANKFTENEIDGAALLCLEQHDLMQILGMKLGPAVKVAGAIQTLRRSLLAMPAAELGPEYADAIALATSCFQKKPLPPSGPTSSSIECTSSVTDISSTAESASGETVNAPPHTPDCPP